MHARKDLARWIARIGAIKGQVWQPCTPLHWGWAGHRAQAEWAHSQHFLPCVRPSNLPNVQKNNLTKYRGWAPGTLAMAACGDATMALFTVAYTMNSKVAMPQLETKTPKLAVTSVG